MKRKSWKGKQNSPIPYRAPKFNRTSRLERIDRLEKHLNVGVVPARAVVTPYGFGCPSPSLLEACPIFIEQRKKQLRSETQVFVLTCNRCAIGCNQPSEAGREYWNRPVIVNRYGKKSLKEN